MTIKWLQIVIVGFLQALIDALSVCFFRSPFPALFLVYFGHWRKRLLRIEILEEYAEFPLEKT